MGYQDIIYRHTKGHFYRIVHFGLDEETLEPEVAYRRCNRDGSFMEGQTFHRKCSVFFDGRFWPQDDRDSEPEEITNIFADDPARPVESPATFLTKRQEPLVLDKEAFLRTDQFEIEPPQTDASMPRHVTPRRVVPTAQVGRTEQQIAASWPEGGFGDGKL